MRVSPAAEVRVSGLFGLWEGTGALEGIDQILPKGAQSGAVRLSDVPPIGPLWVTVDVPEVGSAGQDITEATEVHTVTIVVWAVPWVLIGAAVLLVAALVIAIVNLRRRRRARRASDGRASGGERLKSRE